MAVLALALCAGLRGGDLRGGNIMELGTDFYRLAHGRLEQDVDRSSVDKRRGGHNRLGFAVQLMTVRFPGTFLPDPLDVPTVVLHVVAEQVRVADASVGKVIWSAFDSVPSGDRGGLRLPRIHRRAAGAGRLDREAGVVERGRAEGVVRRRAATTLGHVGGLVTAEHARASEDLLEIPDVPAPGWPERLPIQTAKHQTPGRSVSEPDQHESIIRDTGLMLTSTGRLAMVSP